MTRLDRRGVSETVGFVLVVSLVLVSVGFTYTMGLSALHDVQEAEETSNMAKAFDVLENNVGELYRGGAPSRSTEIRLTGGTLHYGKPVNVTVRAEVASDPSDNETFRMRPVPIVYTEGDTEFVYVGGATLRADRDGTGAVMLDAPGFRNDSTRAVVPLIWTYAHAGSESVAGESTVLVVAHRFAEDYGSFDNGTSVNVTITVESPRAEAWARYFERQGYHPIDADPSDGAIAYNFTTARLYVPKTVVEVELRG